MNTLYPILRPAKCVYDLRISLALLAKGFRPTNVYFYSGGGDTFEFEFSPKLEAEIAKMTRKIDRQTRTSKAWMAANSVMGAVDNVAPDEALNAFVPLCDVGVQMLYRSMTVEERKKFILADAKTRAEMVRAAYGK